MVATNKKIEIPLTKELQEFISTKYANQTSKLIDEFLVYFNTKREANELN